MLVLLQLHSVNASRAKKVQKDFIHVDCRNVSRPPPTRFLVQPLGKAACGESKFPLDARSLMHIAYLSIGKGQYITKRTQFNFAAISHVERRSTTMQAVYHMVTSEDAEDMRRRVCYHGQTSALYTAGRLHVHSLLAAPADALEMHQKLSSLASGNGRFYLWKNVLHLLLPKWIPRVLFLDADLFFLSDPALLWQHFDHFSPGQHIGMSVEESKSRHDVYSKGGISFNSGVLLLDLDGLRHSELYSRLLTRHSDPTSEKLGWTADQSLFSDMSKNASGGKSLFCEQLASTPLRDRAPLASTIIDAKLSSHSVADTLPCGWNLQTSTNGIALTHAASQFRALHHCDAPCHVIHGNEFESKKFLWTLIDRHYDRSTCRALLEQYRCHVDPFRKVAPAARMHGFLARQCCK